MKIRFGQTSYGLISKTFSMLWVQKSLKVVDRESESHSRASGLCSIDRIHER